jgi:hypothetical protein
MKVQLRPEDFGAADLGPAAFVILAAVRFREAEGHQGPELPSVTSLCNLTGRQRPAVRAAIYSLRRAGFLPPVPSVEDRQRLQAHQGETNGANDEQTQAKD